MSKILLFTEQARSIFSDISFRKSLNKSKSNVMLLIAERSRYVIQKSIVFRYVDNAAWIIMDIIWIIKNIMRRCP